MLLPAQFLEISVARYIVSWATFTLYGDWTLVIAPDARSGENLISTWSGRNASSKTSSQLNTTVAADAELVSIWATRKLVGLWGTKKKRKFNDQYIIWTSWKLESIHTSKKDEVLAMQVPKLHCIVSRNQRVPVKACELVTNLVCSHYQKELGDVLSTKTLSDSTCIPKEFSSGISNCIHCSVTVRYKGFGNGELGLNLWSRPLLLICTLPHKKGATHIGIWHNNCGQGLLLQQLPETNSKPVVLFLLVEYPLWVHSTRMFPFTSEDTFPRKLTVSRDSA